MSICRVYKIINYINDEVYVGSTTKTLSERFSNHKSVCKTEFRNNPLYEMMLEHGFEYFEIVLLEEAKIENDKERFELEEKWMDELKPTLNIRHAVKYWMGMCEHGTIRRQCKNCDGVSICKHSIRKAYCKLCYLRICKLCLTSTSRGNWDRHVKSQKHQQNLLKSIPTDVGIVF